MKDKSHKNQLSATLKMLRSERGLTQQQMADAFNITSVTYLRYEKGQREPSIDTLIALAEFFDASIDFLVGISEV